MSRISDRNQVAGISILIFLMLGIFWFTLVLAKPKYSNAIIVELESQKTKQWTILPWRPEFTRSGPIYWQVEVSARQSVVECGEIEVIITCRHRGIKWHAASPIPLPSEERFFSHTSDVIAIKGGSDASLNDLAVIEVSVNGSINKIGVVLDQDEVYLQPRSQGTPGLAGWEPRGLKQK